MLDAGARPSNDQKFRLVYHKADLPLMSPDGDAAKHGVHPEYSGGLFTVLKINNIMSPAKALASANKFNMSFIKATLEL